MWTGEPKWGYAGLGVWAFTAPIAGCAEPVEKVHKSPSQAAHPASSPDATSR